MFYHSKHQNSRALSRFRLLAHHVRSSLARVFSSTFEDSTIDLWVDFHRSLGQNQTKTHPRPKFFSTSLTPIPEYTYELAYVLQIDQSSR